MRTMLNILYRYVQLALLYVYLTTTCSVYLTEDGLTIVSTLVT